MFRDRFLVGIIIGIGVLILGALILFFARQGQLTYVDDSTPAGALRNYILAIQKHDYPRAYGYLADSPSKPDLSFFEQSFLSYQGQAINNTVLEIGETIPDSQNQTAVVQISTLQGNPGLFGDTYRSQMTAEMVHQNGAWKVSSIPYPYSVPEPPVPAPIKSPPTLTPAPTSTATP